MIGSGQFPAFGGQVVVSTTDPGSVETALAMARASASAFTSACTRFDKASELSRLNRSAGTWVELGPILSAAVATALTGAAATGGLVDPAVGEAVIRAGYDRDFRALRAQPERDRASSAPHPLFSEIEFDPVLRRVRVPAGVTLDLGATAKALFADHTAGRIAATIGTGVLVSAGGDLAVAGGVPKGGWLVGVAEHHADPPRTHVYVEGGGLATSGTKARSWIRGGKRQHHLIDPRTGESAETPWQTVSVAAASAVDANLASTASVILGHAAIEWLQARGLAALLVEPQGREHYVGGWPTPIQVPC